MEKDNAVIAEMEKFCIRVLQGKVKTEAETEVLPLVLEILFKISQ